MAQDSNPYLTDAGENPYLVAPPAAEPDNLALTDPSSVATLPNGRDLAQAGGAALARVAGMPGDLATTIAHAGDYVGQVLSGNTLPDNSKSDEAPFLPGSQTLESKILGAPKTDADVQSRGVGEMTADIGMLGAGAADLGPAVAHGIAKATELARDAFGSLKGSVTPEVAQKTVAETFEPSELATNPDTEGLAFRQRGVELHHAYEGARTAAANPDLQLAKQTAATTGADQRAGRDITGYLIAKFTGRPVFLRQPILNIVGQDVKTAADTSTDTKKLIQWTENEIRNPDGSFKSIEGLDNVVRDLSDEGKMGEVIGGASAKEQEIARTMATNIRQIIRANSPEYGKYLDTYKANSEPLKPFEQNNIGSAVVDRANGVGRKTPSMYNYDTDFKTPVAKLQEKFFANQQGYQTGKQIYGADFMQNRATNYTAQSLAKSISGRKGPGEAANIVKQFVTKNTWLQEPENAELLKNVQDLQSYLKSVHSTRAVLFTGAAVAAIVQGGLSVWGLRALMGHTLQ